MVTRDATGFDDACVFTTRHTAMVRQLDDERLRQSRLLMSCT